MRTLMNSVLILVGLFVAGLALMPAAASSAGKPESAPAAEPPPPPKSAFTIDPATSRDPFFPQSKRLTLHIPKTNDMGAPILPVFPDEIRLNGIGGAGGRKVVIVNNKTAEKGEKFELLIKGVRVKVQCLDIKEKSAVFEVNGATKELHIRPAFQ